MSRKVYQYDYESGSFLNEFPSVTKAAEQAGVDQSHIHKVAKGIRVRTGNFVWSYEKADNYIDTSPLERYALQRGIDPETITKVGVRATKDGDNLYSIEAKPKPSEKSKEEATVEYVQGKMKLLQRKKDEVNVLNKNFREYARVENALTALNEALNEQLQSAKFKPLTYEHADKKGTVLVVQVTDLHFNELVEMPDNEFGFKVGAKRMQKYAQTIREMARLYNVSNIVVALTGDIINSDRRLDEKLHMATNRTKASLIASQILYHFLQDINRVANLSIVSVSGNESRINEEWGMSEITMSDNYDFLVYNMLKMLFKQHF